MKNVGHESRSRHVVVTKIRARDRTLNEISSLARSHSRAAINVLAGIMRSAGAPPAARVSAANALLDRGWGRPAQPIESGENGALEMIHRIERVIVQPGNPHALASERTEQVPLPQLSHQPASSGLYRHDQQIADHPCRAAIDCQSTRPDRMAALDAGCAVESAGAHGAGGDHTRE